MYSLAHGPVSVEEVDVDDWEGDGERGTEDGREVL